jgi:septal ring factor EnvC (AmiA/AmiB activator)
MPNRPFRRCLFTRLLALIAAVALAGGLPPPAAAADIGVVTADDLNLRPEPGTGAPPLATLKKGTEVEILGRSNGWLKVRHGRQEGYVRDADGYVHVIALDDRAADSASALDARNRVERYQREVDDIHRRIDDAEQQVRTFTSKEVDLLTNLNSIDHAIDSARRRLAGNKAELAALERQIADNRQAHKALVKAIDTNEDYAAERLVAMYKLNRLGTLSFLASSGSVYELIQRTNYLEHILAQDSALRQTLIEDKARLKAVLDRLGAQQAKKQEIETAMQTQLRELAAKRTERSRVLETVRTKKSLQMEAVDSLKQAADALDGTIARLVDSPETQIKNMPLHSFAELKGLLNMPVKGKIVSFFGPHRDAKFNVTVFRSGIDIESQTGSNIQAVYAGRVLYADWFKGYGNMVIIDHGDSYYTVYAHLQDLFKNKGDFVNTGEDIATVGDAGSLIGPVLHFEVRHHGKPLDPMRWITSG